MENESLTATRLIQHPLTRRRFLAGTLASGAAASASLLGATAPAYASSPGRAREGEFLPTGEQFEIKRGSQTAVVTEVGATLRSYSVAGHEFLDTFDPTEIPDAARGQVLIPWPNRIDGGMYTFMGMAEQLPINEVARNNAIHGIVRWRNWKLVKHDAHEVVQSLVLHPSDGYPFVLDLRISYLLTEDRLVVTTTATNRGTGVAKVPAPFAAGYHPYIMVGTPTIDTDTLRLPANTFFLTNARLIPTGTASVAGTPFDFRTPRVIGATAMDTGFTDLIFDADGFARVTLAAPGGRPTITVFMDKTHNFLQVFTGDPLPAPRRRTGLAVEPYTAATNAFNSGLGLRVLASGEPFTNVWGLRVS